MPPEEVTVNVNGCEIAAEIEARMLLSDFIRHKAGLTGTITGTDDPNATSGAVLNNATVGIQFCGTGHSPTQCNTIPSGTPTLTAASDGNGVFDFSTQATSFPLDVGEYQLTVTRTGYQPSAPSPVFLDSGTNSQSVLLFSLGSRLLAPPIETVVLALILLVGLAGVTLLPGLWTRPRTIEGIAGAAGIGLGATVVFLLLDVVLLQHIGTYTNRWYEIGRSNWWYHPVWWITGTFLPWMGAWILANQLERNGRVSLPAAFGTAVVFAVLAAVVAVLVSLVAASATAVAVDKTVVVTVDGHDQVVHTFAADVAGGKGRYNLCIGLFGLAAGIGATLSTAAAGYVADHFGNAVSFFGLAGAGALAVLLVWLVMPETRVANGDAAADEPAAASPEQAR